MNKQRNIYSKQAQEDFFSTGNTLSYDFRKAMLLRFKEMLNMNKDRIAAAVEADFGKAYFEAYATEILMIYDELNYMLKNLKSLMKPKRVRTSLVHF